MPRRRTGFTLIELAVIAALAGVLVAVGAWAVAITGERHNRVHCASNLRAIGQALNMYAGQERGMYPRTQYVVGAPPSYGTNAGNPDSMTLVNDVTGALFTLLKFADCPPATFICPSTDQEADSMGGQPARSRSNFSDYTRNLSYSYANPYPDVPPGNVGAGYRLNNSMTSGFAVAADANPGAAALPGLLPTMTAGQLRPGNSKNHFRDGQNVLYNDGSVIWCSNCLAGANKDNIYTGRASQPWSPLDATDSVLLPISSAPERSRTPWVSICSVAVGFAAAGVLGLAGEKRRGRKPVFISQPAADGP